MGPPPDSCKPSNDGLGSGIHPNLLACCCRRPPGGPPMMAGHGRGAGPDAHGGRGGLDGRGARGGRGGALGSELGGRNRAGEALELEVGKTPFSGAFPCAGRFGAGGSAPRESPRRGAYQGR